LCISLITLNGCPVKGVFLDELEALLILSQLPLVGSIKVRLLMQHYGSATAVLKAPLEEIASFPGFGTKILQSWKKGLEEGEWKQNLILAERLQAHLIPFTSPHYPKRLLEIGDYPLILYVQGELRKEDQRCLAVVGTRQASVYGQEIAHRLSGELTQAGFTIVSGLARGIDTAAHRGALEKGRTLAVLGSGLASLYPTENIALAGAIRQQGALISEFAMATPPDRQNFPQRNRIVSGMTMGTILIEAPQKSGAMLTVERALSQGRPAFALPGRVDQDSFRGNHALIKERKAELIENVEDILKNFEDCSLPLVFKSTKKPSFPLEKEEEELLRQMPIQEVSIEELVAHLQWPVSKLNGLLMGLVLKKIVKEYPGKIYKKI
jgi:DNA processing protein